MQLAKYIFIFAVYCVVPPVQAEYPWDLMKKQEFKSAYMNALGPKFGEKWISKLSGPSEAAVNVTIDGEKYILASSCKQHACDTDNLVIAFGISTKKAYVKLRESSGNINIYGGPSASVLSELNAFYEMRFANN